MSTPTYLVATRSAGKLRELRELFAQEGVRVIDLNEAGVSESPEEAGIEAFDTFEKNACAKAEYFFLITGLPVLADDSGLAINALGGRPGVHSKRWSERPDLDGHALDEANNAKLVASLRSLGPEANRSAEYVCAAAFTDALGSVVTLGRTPGSMMLEPAGENGFGYDPYFYSTELGKSFAQATTLEKLHVSHRGRAFTALLAMLRQAGRMPEANTSAHSIPTRISRSAPPEARS